jgi:hypothetical protein
MVSALDASMGKVVDALKATDQLDRTVIVFTSDNGAPYAAAFDLGDDPAMIEGLKMDPHKVRPPNGTHGPGAWMVLARTDLEQLFHARFHVGFQRIFARPWHFRCRSFRCHVSVAMVHTLPHTMPLQPG